MICVQKFYVQKSGKNLLNECHKKLTEALREKDEMKAGGVKASFHADQ